MKQPSAKKNLRLLSTWLEDDSFYSAEKLEPTALKKASQKNVLSLFEKAAKKVPAYKDFLNKNGVNPSSIKTFDDFVQLPITTKENYIHNYTLAERCWEGDITTAHMISTSSGTTGEAIHWPRSLEHEIDGAYAHEYLFKMLGADKKKTLFINGFAMGSWIAGTFTLACTTLNAWKGYPITAITPGYDLQGVLDSVKTVSPFFEQTIISGHSPFLKEIAESVHNQSANQHKITIKLIGAGQPITENWRDYVSNLVTDKDAEVNLLSIYGSADAAMMGFETFQTIKMKRSLRENKELLKLITNSQRIPNIFAYDPRLIYFEVKKGELVVSKDMGCPLIKYNIHDTGGIVPSEIQTNSNLPMVFLFGREKFMVKIFGANIYSEHVQHALAHPELQSKITGRYKLEINENNQFEQLLFCHVELNKNVQHSEKLAAEISKYFITQIAMINNEYNVVLNAVGVKAHPKIKLYNYQDENLFPKKIIKNA